MSSMKELFPLNGFPKKPQRNFVRENILKAKGCSQCISEKGVMKTNNRGKYKNELITSSSKCCKSENDISLPAVKYNIRIVKRRKSPAEDTRGNRYQSQNSVSINACCQTCGQPVNRKDTTKPSVTENSANELKKDEKELQEPNKDNHKMSHENKELKKEAQAKKSLDLSTYKKGEVPRYLKERNCRLMQEQQEKEEREKLARLLGLNDPACPAGHMLMPLEQIKENLAVFESKYQSLIQELNKMPVSSDSLRIRRRKIEIEKELKDLEDKMELYKTGKVFMKIPDLRV